MFALVPGDRSAELVDQLFDDRALRPAQRHLAGVRRDFQWHAVRRLHHQRQAPGPESFRQFLEIPGRVIHARSPLLRARASIRGLIQRIHQDWQRPGFRSPFHSVQLVHGRKIERVGSQSIERVGGNSNDTASDEEMRRISQCIDFRGLRVHAQQFCRQLFGLWRSRNSSPCSAPPALPLFGRRYHTPADHAMVIRHSAGRGLRRAAFSGLRSTRNSLLELREALVAAHSNAPAGIAMALEGVNLLRSH